MKSITAAAVLAGALAGCGNANELSGPTRGEPFAELSTTPTGYDAAAVVVGDVLTRVLPTLTSGTLLTALESRLKALASALLQNKPALIQASIDAAGKALSQYGASAPDNEEPELDGVEVALQYVTDGLPRPSGGGKGGGRGT